MKVHIVRHARAVSRGAWQSHLRSRPHLCARGDARAREFSRPLSDPGRTQANALAQHLLGADRPDRLICAPAQRCQQTLEPLARMLGVPVEIDERLADGASDAELTGLLAELGDEASVLCTHLRPVRILLEQFELAEDASDGHSACRKGAIWTLEGPDRTPRRAVYVEPAVRAPAYEGFGSASSGTVRAESQRIAVLDMGSTSFTLQIADVGRDGEIRPVTREKVQLRLGAYVAAGDKIPPDAARRAVETASDMRRIASGEKVERFIPVATAALREARNGRKLTEKIGKAVGEPVHLIEGEAEARLMFLAFQRRLALGDEPVLGLDLGGGSLELAVGCGRQIDAEVSLRLGAVRLHGELVRSDPMRPREVRKIRSRVEAAIELHHDTLLGREPTRIVAAGGTARSLARLVAAERGMERPEDALPLTIERADLKDLTDRLIRSDHDERLDMPAMRRRRADILPTGALVLLTTAEVLDLETLTLCDWGLREGVLLDAFGR